jgi:hypothetical protein
MKAPITEARLAEIEARAKSLSREARSHGIVCNDRKTRYGDFDLQALDISEDLVPDLVEALRIALEALRFADDCYNSPSTRRALSDIEGPDGQG